MLPFEVSQQAPSTMDRIANALQGFGAGVAGRGNEFLRNQQLQRQELSDERKRAAAEDLRRAKEFLNNNDLKGLQALAQDRLNYLNQSGRDAFETEQILALAKQAETDPVAYQRVLAEVNSGIRSAADAGFIELETGSNVPSDVQSFNAMIENANIEKGSPDYELAARIKLKLESGANTLDYEDRVELEELKYRLKSQEALDIKRQNRLNEAVTLGLDAVDGIPIIRRSLALLADIKTGGVDNAINRAKQLFGIESANEAELSANLGRAVLSQLKKTFGAAFTEREGDRLERYSAGFGKSVEGNIRILRQTLKLAEDAAKRGLRASSNLDDEFSYDTLNEYLRGDYDLTDEALMSVFSPVQSSQDLSNLSDEELNDLIQRLEQEKKR